MADDFVQGRHQVLSFPAVLGVAFDLGGAGGEFRDARLTGGLVQGAAAPGEEKILGAIFFVDFVFVGQIVAHRGDGEIAGFNQRLYRLHHRRRELLAFVLRVPRSLRFEIAGIFGQFFHGRGDGLVGDGDKTLRASFRAAGVAIDLDEAVVKVHRGVVLHPRGAECHPVRVFAGLVEADERINHLGLRGFGVAASLLKAFDRLLQERGIQSGSDLAVGRAGAVDEFGKFAVRAFDHPRVQRILFLKPLQIVQTQARVKSVRTGLDRVLSSHRTLGGRHRLKRGIKKRSAQ